jgi:hypothetical protein
VYVANGTSYTAELTVMVLAVMDRPTDSQHRSITSTICHIYTVHSTS